MGVVAPGETKNYDANIKSVRGENVRPLCLKKNIYKVKVKQYKKTYGLLDP